jgi:hypothetical protein
MLYAGISHAAPTYTVIGGTTCKQVLKFCSQGKLECLIISSWSAGFISGHNWTKMNEDLTEIVRRKLPKSPMDVALPFEVVRDSLIKKCQKASNDGQVDVTLDIMLEYYRSQ